MSTTKQRAIRQLAAHRNLGLDISRPGDGFTRYTFTTPDGGRDLSRVLRGPRQAELWLHGYDAGRDPKRP